MSLSPQKQQILTELTELCRDILDDDSLTLTMATTADSVPNWDSMSHIAIVTAAEQKFGIKFRTAEIEELHSVGDFVDLIAEKKGIV
ncbi:acyl carrier protein [Komagataeibacter sp. AV436]|uniref:Acyl carrier protein n=1 Tax=Komagataeibacter melomenusus TaxID=2766578 RepID=A0ABX2AHF8_9PROT|nr:acyl carrier protein [Komagataeibacter melomenusus]MBV1831315.1 acyl carrier protein [Komagataeibacter melomenusus]NPC67056.1 acyl carrier protein [Komagataeibacter melomenusus]